jgi:hypothetical protein
VPHRDTTKKPQPSGRGTDLYEKKAGFRPEAFLSGHAFTACANTAPLRKGTASAVLSRFQNESSFSRRGTASVRNRDFPQVPLPPTPPPPPTPPNPGPPPARFTPQQEANSRPAESSNESSPCFGPQYCTWTQFGTQSLCPFSQLFGPGAWQFCITGTTDETTSFRPWCQTPPKKMGLSPGAPNGGRPPFTSFSIQLWKTCQVP